MGWDISSTMSGYSAHLTTEERKYWEWNDEFFLKCVGFYIGMYFMLEDTWGNESHNNRREAIMRIEEAAAKGQSPISPDYAPAELVESMVPPAGDWEKIWLARQPSTMVKGANKWIW